MQLVVHISVLLYFPVKVPLSVVWGRLEKMYKLHRLIFKIVCVVSSRTVSRATSAGRPIAVVLEAPAGNNIHPARLMQ